MPGPTEEPVKRCPYCGDNPIADGADRCAECARIWCDHCGDYEVAAEGQWCAECLTEKAEWDGGNDWNGPDTMEEDYCHGI